MIKLGEFTKLEVLRKSDLGYMLGDGENEVLLHFKQSSNEHKDGDKVNVFIYADKSGRPTATEIAPTVSMGKPGFAKVVSVLPGSGVFVTINTPKDVFISRDYLPYDETAWPQIDDELFVDLKIKKNMLLAKPLGRYDIVALHRHVNYLEGEDVQGVVIRVGDKGLGIITHDPMYIFVPNTQKRGNYRLGENVTVTITKSLGEEYYGTMNARKEDMIGPDKELILKYLNEHHGVMIITEKSSPELIEKTFGISKKAFKRAYGGLYKDRVIDFDEEKTFLIQK